MNICLEGARQKLAGKTHENCGDCVLLNVDRLAKVRAACARPSPFLRYNFSDLFRENFGSLKPARPKWSHGQ